MLSDAYRYLSYSLARSRHLACAHVASCSCCTETALRLLILFPFLATFQACYDVNGRAVEIRTLYAYIVLLYT